MATLTDTVATGREPSVLARVKHAPVNCAVWRRQLTPSIAEAAQALTQGEKLDLHVLGDGAAVSAGLAVALIKRARSVDLIPLLDDIGDLVDRFRRLMRLDAALAQIETVDGNGCRFFHADRVHGRLLCTYVGPGTVIAPEDIVDRAALGSGDNERVLIGDQRRLVRLDAGDVGVLMGDLAHAESRRGVVHRSPVIADSGILRLVLRIDFPGACNCATPHAQFRFRPG